jgi:hypothetical protein
MLTLWPRTQVEPSRDGKIHRLFIPEDSSETEHEIARQGCLFSTGRDRLSEMGRITAVKPH